MLNTQQTLQVTELMYDLGWDETDDIVIEVGGTVVSGIHQPEDANPKWSRNFGERGYSKDAFIVIKNKSRNPVVPSITNVENSNTPCPKCNKPNCTCPR